MIEKIEDHWDGLCDSCGTSITQQFGLTPLQTSEVLERILPAFDWELRSDPVVDEILTCNICRIAERLK